MDSLILKFEVSHPIVNEGAHIAAVLKLKFGCDTEVTLKSPTTAHLELEGSEINEDEAKLVITNFFRLAAGTTVEFK